MRPPAAILAVDAAVLVSALLGKTTGPLHRASQAALLVTTDRVVVEVRRRVELGLKRPELLAILGGRVAEINVVPVARLTPLLPDSESALKDAVPSRNGSTRDANLLALARSADADIWTHGRDFAGTGIATWSTTNLMRALGA